MVNVLTSQTKWHRESFFDNVSNARISAPEGKQPPAYGTDIPKRVKSTLLEGHRGSFGPSSHSPGRGDYFKSKSKNESTRNPAFPSVPAVHLSYSSCLDLYTLLALVHLPARSFQHTQDHGTALRKLPTRLPLPSPWSPSSPSRLPRLPPVGSALCLSACVTPPTAPSQTLGSFVTSACFLRCLSLAGWRSSRRDKDFKASRMEPYTMPAFIHV